MNRARMILLALAALAVSAILTLFVYRQLSARLRPELDEQQLQIIVAAENLPLGMLLDETHLKTAPWAQGIPIEGAFESKEDVIGRGVIVSMVINEPVIESKLAPMDAGAGLSTVIPEGMRAVSLRVNDVAGVSGFAFPGSRVDVILSGNAEGTGGIDISKVILENVEIIAAGTNIVRDAQGEPKKVSVITVLVTPEQAQVVALASLDGQIRLALRNPLDLEQADPAPFRRASLYTGSSDDAMPPPVEPASQGKKRVVRRVKAPPPPPPPPPAPIIVEVEVIQGTDRKTMTFEKSKGEPK
ncbi:MAG TPA: Flp pilus assembly protein CpaB [Acidobacteriota bacterium]|nr:Flp pilus assembly protein CpaB [Acidobacteriota bacterium]